MKQTIRLSESQLTEVIRKTVKKALKEEDYNNPQKRTNLLDAYNSVRTVLDDMDILFGKMSILKKQDGVIGENEMNSFRKAYEQLGILSRTFKEFNSYVEKGM